MKLVLVDWVDSHGPHGSPWLSADEVPGLGELLECRSVGWWVGETSNPKAITLAPHRHLADDGSDSGYCGLLTIPMRAVTRIEVLVTEEQRAEKDLRDSAEKFNPTEAVPLEPLEPRW